MGNVAHRKNELLNDSHHEAGFGDLGWSLERLKWQGDICLATPIAETPSALCNVWNRVRDHIPSAVTNGTGHFCHLHNLGFKSTKKIPENSKLNQHASLSSLFSYPAILCQECTFLDKPNLPHRCAAYPQWLHGAAMQNSVCAELLFSQEVCFPLGLKLRSVQRRSSLSPLTASMSPPPGSQRGPAPSLGTEH